MSWGLSVWGKPKLTHDTSDAHGRAARHEEPPPRSWSIPQPKREAPKEAFDAYDAIYAVDKTYELGYKAALPVTWDCIERLWDLQKRSFTREEVGRILDLVSQGGQFPAYKAFPRME